MTEAKPFALACPLPEDDGERVQLAHGGGGLLTQRLIDGLFRPVFALDPADFTHDGAVLDTPAGRLAFTTDSYVVDPLFFPGGDIGTLAVNGTVNDLAMCGARPLYLSAGFIIEEGFAIADLRRVVHSMRAAAEAAGVRLVTGDTKVVQRGRGDGLYVNTAGVGQVVAGAPVCPAEVRPGDAVLLSGDVGRHGMAVMSVREGLGFETAIDSDCAPLAAPVLALIDSGIEVHCLRDLTRGGLATALVEIAEAGQADMLIEEAAIPVSNPVRGACEILGLDPLYVANEGRFIAFVPARQAEAALALLRRFETCRGATLIGAVVAEGEGRAARGVALRGALGGTRMLDRLSGEQLPRIC